MRKGDARWADTFTQRESTREEGVISSPMATIHSHGNRLDTSQKRYSNTGWGWREHWRNTKCFKVHTPPHAQPRGREFSIICTPYVDSCGVLQHFSKAGQYTHNGVLLIFQETRLRGIFSIVRMYLFPCGFLHQNAKMPDQSETGKQDLQTTRVLCEIRLTVSIIIDLPSCQ